MVQTKIREIYISEVFTLLLSIAKIHENCILELASQSKFVKYRALENNQLYGTSQISIFMTRLWLCLLCSLCQLGVKLATIVSGLHYASAILNCYCSSLLDPYYTISDSFVTLQLFLVRVSRHPVLSRNYWFHQFMQLIGWREAASQTGYAALSETMLQYLAHSLTKLKPDQ